MCVLPAAGSHKATQFIEGGIQLNVHLSVRTATKTVERVTSALEKNG